jgi:hypothetical protein
MTVITTSKTTVGEPAGVDVAPKGGWSGYNGSAGFQRIFPATLDKGYLHFACVDNVGNFGITVQNAAFGQASTLTIPDPGAAAANFVLDTGVIAAGVGSSSPGSLTGVTNTLRFVRGGVTYYLPLYSVNT